ncbi:hypothetical protein [Micromonospora globispora]|nr:hypothetical protein [Micromonospora globispora]
MVRIRRATFDDSDRIANVHAVGEIAAIFVAPSTGRRGSGWP